MRMCRKDDWKKNSVRKTQPDSDNNISRGQLEGTLLRVKKLGSRYGELLRKCSTVKCSSTALTSLRGTLQVQTLWRKSPYWSIHLCVASGRARCSWNRRARKCLQEHPCPDLAVPWGEQSGLVWTLSSERTDGPDTLTQPKEHSIIRRYENVSMFTDQGDIYRNIGSRAEI